MSLKKLTLADWQSLLDQFRNDNKGAKPHAAFRIDNTPFSTARHYGGFTMDGDRYTVFYFADGALLGVRDDFLRWAKRKQKEAK